MKQSDNLLEIENLRISFRLDKQTVFDAVKGISFVIPPDSTIALVGESGSGKSVSAMAILGLLPEESAIVSTESVIQYKGRNLLKESRDSLRRVRGKDISVIFQEPMTSLNPVFTVGGSDCRDLAPTYEHGTGGGEETRHRVAWRRWVS
jgi:peptide/nickel transport system ATP-binding protein